MNKPGPVATLGKIAGMVIVRDRYGRIVVDEAIFYDDDKLKLLKQEVLKNGSYAPDRNS